MNVFRYIVVILISLQTLAASAQSAVIAGDYPDPSVVKVGDTYWASATSSNWFPAFPLLKSRDLLNWQLVGSIFTKLPDWADFYFWAPEIRQENGTIYVYYTAHKKGGNLCVAVASADRPEGPYRDHGPLVGQVDGSIDGSAIRDETGKLYLIWKEDGNSINQPTPIWAQPMKEDRTALTGDKQELFRDDAFWEHKLVEGVSIIKHGAYFYAFYAGAGCCGTGCSYATGVARAKHLLGPWEKYGQNPVLTEDAQWRCPGHGTAVEKDGRFYFLYHAFNRQNTVYAGRQALLKEFRFTDDGWINFLPEAALTVSPTTKPSSFSESFREKVLSDRWQWSVFHQPDFTMKKGALNLTAQPSAVGGTLAQRTLSGDYTATTTIDRRRSTGQPGLVAIGDEDNALGVSVDGQTLLLWKVERTKKLILSTQTIKTTKSIKLRLTAQQGHRFTFAYSTDGKTYQPLNAQPIEGAFLPPWDRAVRVGITAVGSGKQQAVFDEFVLQTTLP